MKSYNFIVESLYEESFGRAYLKKLKSIVEAPENNIAQIQKISDKALSERKHVDFGDISKSNGDITKYSGYKAMKECLQALNAIEVEEKPILKFVYTCNEALSILEKKKMLISSAYHKSKNIALEYDSYVYMLVQSISSILSQFVRASISEMNGRYEVKLCNSKYRADLFYFKELDKFNDMIGSKDYDVICKSAISGQDRDNLLGLFGIGAAVLVSKIGVIMGLAVLSRLSVLLVYKSRVSVTKSLDEMAAFLELRKALMQSNVIGNNISTEKKERIMESQQKWIDRFNRLADIIRVNISEDERVVRQDIAKNNSTIKDELSSDSSGGILF